MALIAVAGCAAKDMEVVTGPDPDSTTSTTGVVVDDPADEEGEEQAAGSSTNAEAPEETSTSSSSSSTSSTTTTEPDGDDDGGTTSTEPTTPDPSNLPPPAQPGDNLDRTAAEQSVAFVNDRRGEYGRSALGVDGELQALAEGWAQRMAEDQEMRHNPNLGDQIPGRYYAWGENVAYGFDSDAINQGWWESDGHRENMLSENYTAIGVGFAVDGDGDLWAVQVFAGS